MDDKDFEKEIEYYMENGDELIFGYPMELPEVWLNQNRKTKKFTFGLETILRFANTHEAMRHVKNALGAFTRWMIENNHNVGYRFDYWEVFKSGISLERQYDTIEEAYAAFRILALGFITNARDTADDEDKNKKIIDNIVFKYDPNFKEWVASSETPFEFEMADTDIFKLAEKIHKVIPEMEKIERLCNKRIDI